jgi:hypothetical protein
LAACRPAANLHACDAGQRGIDETLIA